MITGGDVSGMYSFMYWRHEETAFILMHATTDYVKVKGSTLLLIELEIKDWGGCLKSIFLCALCDIFTSFVPPANKVQAMIVIHSN